jgi:hypothetical protein
MWLYFRLFLLGIRMVGGERRELVLENLALRQQLAVLQRRGWRPTRIQRSSRSRPRPADWVRPEQTSSPNRSLVACIMSIGGPPDAARGFGPPQAHDAV